MSVISGRDWAIPREAVEAYRDGDRKPGPKTKDD